ncbi:MAG TPA: QueT transporter family protein [Nitrososphaerales archaeon]|nr:QueT transporter family protein [Nitrososphaerales archaeon]
MGHLVRSAIETPVRDVKMDSKQIALISIFAALYAIGVVFLAPFSYGLIQVRIADALLPLSIVFGMPVVIGLSLGTFIANILNPVNLGPIDILGGTVTNFIATFVAWKICGSNKVPFIVGIGCQIVIVSVIVGTYLSYLLGSTLIAGIGYLFIGTFLAVGVLGSILVVIIKDRVQSIGIINSKNKP